MERKSGVLLPIFSLPTAYGIGTFGKEATAFVDFLKKAGQSYWQILPLNPTSYGDSPYQSFSAFALNPYFIDLETLKEEGLLVEKDLEQVRVPYSTCVDYGRIYNTRFNVLRKAYKKAVSEGFLDSKEYKDFMDRESFWLPSFAAFMVLKAKFGGKSFQEWPLEYKDHQSDAVKQAIQENEEEIHFYEFQQFEAFKQYEKLKAYANKHGIKIIGDIPIYAALDSSDVWGNPQDFQLSDSKQPLWVAGVPPDYFSATGQLWGNPIYNYSYMEKEGFTWWKNRVKAASKIYDILRIDHFRGMADYWAIPFGSETAKPGHWVLGPGEKLVDAIKEAAGKMQIIAEDLGDLDETVYKLKRYAGWPGMKIFQFGFDAGDPKSNFLPDNYEENSVAYLGTHDNETTLGFINGHPNLYPFMEKILKTTPDHFFDKMMEDLALSKSFLVIYTMQDALRLGNETRLNMPSTLGGINWQFRLPLDYAKESVSDYLLHLVQISNRQ